MSNPTTHTWTGNVVALCTAARVRHRQTFLKVLIDFDALRVARGGLLEETIRDARCPLSATVAYYFKRILDAVCEQEDARAVLSAHPQEISVPLIHMLFGRIDAEVGAWNHAHPYVAFIAARRIFLFCRCPLRTGQLLSEVAYLSRHGTRRGGRVKPLISEMSDPTFADASLSGPISALPHTNSEDLERMAVAHLSGRLERIRDSCIDMLDKHAVLVEEIKRLKALGLPDSLHPYTMRSLDRRGGSPIPNTLRKLSVEEHFRVVLYLVERDLLFQNRSIRHAFALESLHELRTVSRYPDSRSLHNALLADYYLPRLAVIACLLLLLIDTGWNGSTALGLTAKRVSKHGAGYRIVGVKTRTDQVQTASIPESDDTSEFVTAPTAVRALDLLLAYDASVTKYGKRDSDSLFVSMQHRVSDRVMFFIPDINECLKDFCAHYNIPHFTLRQIRDQVANREYLRGGKDPYRIRTLLGHANIGTTADYLDSHVLRLLNEANINRYMKRLAASALFAVDRAAQLPALALDRTDVDERLLFPVSRFSREGEEAIADQWLAADGEFSFVIGEAEIQHCVLQKRFYEEALPDLKQGNPERFVHYHLPRILFCAALYRFIEVSPYRNALNAIEESICGQS
jgi:integrase